MTWLSPPGWASQMIFTTYQPAALDVEMLGGGDATRCGGGADGCVDVFAAMSMAGDAITVRLVNAGNASQPIDIRVVGGADGRPVRLAPEVELLSLTSPLSSNQTAYDLNQGGVNPVGDPLRVSTVRSTVKLGPTGRWELPPHAFQVLLLRVQ